MIEEVHAKGHFLAHPKAAAIEFPRSQHVRPGWIFEPARGSACGRKEVLIQLGPLFKKLPPKLAANQISCTVRTKRNRAPRYQPKLGNEEPKSWSHLRK